jgi:hypothetical protein
MKKRVVILNDELGTMALGFSKAGYDIGAIYIDFSDTMNCSVCEKNWGPIIRDISQMGTTDNESELSTDTDCIAGRIHTQFSVAKKRENVLTEINPYSSIECAIKKIRPKCIIVQSLGINRKDERYYGFCKKLVDSGYCIKEENIETGVITGFPVKEKISVLFGALNEDDINLNFLKNIEYPNYDMEDFIEKEAVIDDWYYEVNQNVLDVKDVITENSFLCWNCKQYKKDDWIRWNFMKVPLVYWDGRIRKITHTEVARLKGIPDEYFLPKRNKSMLYKKLMSCSNVQLVQELASLLCFSEDEKVFRKREVFKGLQFEKIFVSFLNQKGIYNALKTEGSNTYIDFQYKTQKNIYNFEFRIYNNNLGLRSKLLTVCKNRFEKELGEHTTNVLVVGNIVGDGIKTLIKERYNVVICDIENILWLLEDFPKLKSDFIALLSFSVSAIVPRKPELDIFNWDVKSIEKVDLQEQLRRITPGKEDATKYEELCVDIVKFLFSEHIQFYKEQRRSNAGLYRFDYCGKIKHGNISEFFDTIQSFFNTKYIIFEFKNYKEEITQKEIYTTEKYLYEKALRKVAIVISRKGSDESAKKATRGSLRELGKLIICLSDEDVNKLIDKKNNNEDPADYLEALLDDMLMDLEK